MHGVLAIASPRAIKSDRQFCPSTDKIVTRKFGKVAKVLWPDNTAAFVASIEKVSVRHAERLLAGEFEVSSRTIIAVIAEITEPQESNPPNKGMRNGTGEHGQED
jgi:hypothetical protein